MGKDLDGVITSWNAGAERLFGYAAEEVVGRPITFLIPHDRQDEESNILARLRSGERVEPFDSVRLTRDGRSIDVSLTISPVRDAKGQIVGFSKIARDVGESKRAEETLRQSEEKFRLLAESILQLAWMARPDGHIFWYNRRWYEYTGTTPRGDGRLGLAIGPRPRGAPASAGALERVDRQRRAVRHGLPAPGGRRPVPRVPYPDRAHPKCRRPGARLVRGRIPISTSRRRPRRKSSRANASTGRSGSRSRSGSGPASPTGAIPTRANRSSNSSGSLRSSVRASAGGTCSTPTTPSGRSWPGRNACGPRGIGTSSTVSVGPTGVGIRSWPGACRSGTTTAGSYAGPESTSTSAGSGRRRPRSGSSTKALRKRSVSAPKLSPRRWANCGIGSGGSARSSIRRSSSSGCSRRRAPCWRPIRRSWISPGRAAGRWSAAPSGRPSGTRATRRAARG